jgi:hypothetical protein
MENANSPAWRPDYWQAYLVPLWQRVADIYNGLHTDDVKKQYLRPQLGEHKLVYEIRLGTAFENRLSPAVKSHAGLLSEFELADDAPETLRQNIDNVDGQQNSLQAFLLDWDISGLLYNATLCLVDTPVAQDESQQRRDRRPRFVHVPIKDVYAPRCVLDDGVLKIQMVSIKRCVTVDEGIFGRKDKDQYWVYWLQPLDTPINQNGILQNYAAYFQVWEKLEDGRKGQDGSEYAPVSEALQMRDAGGRSLDTLPIVWYSPFGDPLLFHGVDNPMDRGGTPEYMPLVDLNIEYLNKHSELNTAESRCNYAMLVKRYQGTRPEQESDMLSNGRVVILENGAELFLLESEGTAIASTREGQDRRLKQMDAISNAFLTGGEAERTATEAIIESSQSRLGLRNIARRKESAVQQMCYWWERFANPSFNPFTDTVGGIEVSESVLNMPASPEQLRFWMDAWLNGALTATEWKAKMRELGEYTEEMEAAAEQPSTGLNLNFSGAQTNGNLSSGGSGEAGIDFEPVEGS